MLKYFSLSSLPLVSNALCTQQAGADDERRLLEGTSPASIPTA